MLITKIEVKDVIKIGYITHENELETKQNLASKEWARPEFQDAWQAVEHAVQRYFWQDTEDNEIDLLLEKNRNRLYKAAAYRTAIQFLWIYDDQSSDISL